jgi:hypothetical protein
MPLGILVRHLAQASDDGLNFPAGPPCGHAAGRDWAIRKAEQWSGGSKGSKGGVTEDDKRNDNSSAKT